MKNISIIISLLLFGFFTFGQIGISPVKCGIKAQSVNGECLIIPPICNISTNDGFVTATTDCGGEAKTVTLSEASTGCDVEIIELYLMCANACHNGCEPLLPIDKIDTDGDGTPDIVDEDPNDPCIDADYSECETNEVVAGLDCDEGGITDCQEITDGKDPTNPDDDACNPEDCAKLLRCETGYVGDCVDGACECRPMNCDEVAEAGINLCDIDLENHPILGENSDCDNGGISNIIECNAGDDPSDPSDDAGCATDEDCNEQTIVESECNEETGSYIQTITTYECVDGDCVSIVVENTLPCGEKPCKTICIGVFGSDNDTKNSFGYSVSGSGFFGQDLQNGALIWQREISGDCIEACNIGPSTVQSGGLGGSLAYSAELAADIGGVFGTNSYGLFNNNARHYIIYTECGVCSEFSVTATNENGGVAQLDFEYAEVEVCIDEAPAVSNLQVIECAVDPCADVECEGLTECVDGVCECTVPCEDVDNVGNYECAGTDANGNQLISFQTPAMIAAGTPAVVAPLLPSPVAGGAPSAVLGGVTVKGKRTIATNRIIPCSEENPDCPPENVIVNCGDDCCVCLGLDCDKCCPEIRNEDNIAISPELLAERYCDFSFKITDCNGEALTGLLVQGETSAELGEGGLIPSGLSGTFTYSAEGCEALKFSLPECQQVGTPISFSLFYNCVAGEGVEGFYYAAPTLSVCPNGDIKYYFDNGASIVIEVTGPNGSFQYYVGDPKEEGCQYVCPVPQPNDTQARMSCLLNEAVNNGLATTTGDPTGALVVSYECL